MKGSFTGAHSDRAGLVASANGGTLFLDEVGEMPPPMQVKLLRFLQEGTYTPVGARDMRRADVRVICAAHRDLELKMMTRLGLRQRKRAHCARPHSFPARFAASFTRNCFSEGPI